MKKRIVSAVLLLCMLAGLLPVMHASAGWWKDDTPKQLPTTYVHTAFYGYDAAIKTDGSLWVWRYNETEVVDLEKVLDRAVSVFMEDEVGSGRPSLLAIDADGVLWDCTRRVSSAGWDTVPVMKDVVYASRHCETTLVITRDKALWSWGNNVVGTIGDGTTERRETPYKVLDNVASVHFIGGFMDRAVAAITADGQLWAWGSYWATGSGLAEGLQLTPYHVMDHVVDFTFGSDSAAAVTSDGGLWTWGKNDSPLLGDGVYSYTRSRLLPEKIMDGVRSISSSSKNWAAIKKDGTLWVWGMHTGPYVGDDPAWDSVLLPCQIMEDVKDVSIAGGCIAVTKRDGSLWTCGRNDYGLMGDGTTESKTTPQKILEQVHAVFVTNSVNGSICALQENGSLYLWGKGIILSPQKVMEDIALPIGAPATPVSEEDDNTSQNSENVFAIVSLGDSYSSGEGNEPFYGQFQPLEDKIHDEDWLAHRSQYSWSSDLTVPYLSGTLKNYRDTYWYFAASSGAVTRNIWDSQKKEYNIKDGWIDLNPVKGTEYLPPQLDIFGKITNTEVRYVTMTLGGNDVGFGNVIKEAVTGSSYLQHCLFMDKLEDRIHNTWEEFFEPGGTKDRLLKAYRMIWEAAGPQSTLIIAGYPLLLENNGKGFFFSKDEASYINKNVHEFNRILQSLVENHLPEEISAVFVSVEKEFQTHEAYSDNPYLYPVILKAMPEDLINHSIGSSYSIHPNYEGMRVYTECVQKMINHLEEEREQKQEEQTRDSEVEEE